MHENQKKKSELVIDQKQIFYYIFLKIVQEQFVVVVHAIERSKQTIQRNTQSIKKFLILSQTKGKVSKQIRHKKAIVHKKDTNKKFSKRNHNIQKPKNKKTFSSDGIQRKSTNQFKQINDPQKSYIGKGINDNAQFKPP